MTTRVQFDRNGDIDELRTAEVEVPETGPGQVRVQVLYAGLNPVDLTILSGGFGPTKGTRGVGMDFSGIVTEVGDGVEDFSPGQLVFGGYPNHSQAETIVITDPENRLDPIPSAWAPTSPADSISPAAPPSPASVRSPRPPGRRSSSPAPRAEWASSRPARARPRRPRHRHRGPGQRRTPPGARHRRDRLPRRTRGPTGRGRLERHPGRVLDAR
ncbi:alcohol dehydrogenase catalytic domain-containing protein [Brevibacterium casei]|nr:alcohol dehydrogenase catalytic domain-containing protein [Brevibacterium casei]